MPSVFNQDEGEPVAPTFAFLIGFDQECTLPFEQVLTRWEAFEALAPIHAQAAQAVQEKKKYRVTDDNEWD
eukprot:tig00020964_g16818.t1